MYVYIKRENPNTYIYLDKKLTSKMYSNIGKTFNDYLNGCYVLLNADQIKFHNDNKLASVYEVWNMKLDDKTPGVEDWRYQKLAELDAYDKSSEINSFTINGYSMWIDWETRTNYKNSISSAKIAKEPTVSLFINGTMLTMEVNDAEMMLAQIQVYADKCFNVTKQHEMNINAFTTVDEIQKYDFKVNYPQKLNFSYGKEKNILGI